MGWLDVSITYPTYGHSLSLSGSDHAVRRAHRPFWIVMTCMTHRDVVGLASPGD